MLLIETCTGSTDGAREQFLAALVGERGYVTLIVPATLSAEDSARMEALPSKLLALAAAKAEGKPFYVEDLVKSLEMAMAGARSWEAPAAGGLFVLGDVHAVSGRRDAARRTCGGRLAPGWAALMHRAFAIDVLACPNCGGRLRLIGTLHDPADPDDPRARGDGPIRAEPRPRPTRARRRGALTGSARARRRPSCLPREALSALIRPGHVPVDGGGMPAYDAAQPGRRGRRARRLLMCAVASGS